MVARTGDCAVGTWSDASWSAPESLRVAWASDVSRLLNVAVAGQHSFLAFSRFRSQISAR